MPNPLDKARRFATQNPESIHSLTLWAVVVVFGILNICPTTGLVNGLLTLSAIGIVIWGTVFFRDRARNRISRSIRIRDMVNRLVDGGCPCRPLYDCPDKRDCLCVCHSMIEAEG